jgi:hypothetical protein
MSGGGFSMMNPIGMVRGAVNSIVPRAPNPPDPYATADAQTQANAAAIRESARVNRYNTTSPFGSTTWTRPTADPATWSQRITLSPEQQQQLNQQNQVAIGLGNIALDRVGTIPGGDFNLQGIPELNTDFSGQADELERASYDRAMQLMRPGFEEQERRLQTQLANQGLPVGSEAYSSEMNRFGRNRSEAELAAALESVGRGRQEQSRLFGINQAARQQGISDRLLERTQPMNELAALLQGSPALQAPQVPQTAQYQQSPADISGLIQGNYQQQAQNANAAKGGIAQLGGTAAMAKAYAACIPEGQHIDTPYGEMAIEELQVGDIVIGFDGNPVKILQVHSYLEDPKPKRFARIEIGDIEINLCDKHRIDGIPAEAWSVGDEIKSQKIDSIEWYGEVMRSFDLLTEDRGYQIGGIPVNSMIEEMMRLVK